MRAFIIATALTVFAAPALAQHAEEEVAHAHEDVAHNDAAAHEAHDDHGGHEVTLSAIIASSTFRASVIAFLCLLVLFARFARPAVRRSLKKRQRDIEEQLAEAARIKKEAAAMAKEYEERLARLDDVVKRVRDELIAAAEAERDRMVREAEEKAALLRKDTRFQIEQRMKQLREDLTRETVHAAIAAAEAMLLEQSGPSDQTRLANDYVKQVGSAAKTLTAKEGRA